MLPLQKKLLLQQQQKTNKYCSLRLSPEISNFEKSSVFFRMTFFIYGTQFTDYNFYMMNADKIYIHSQTAIPKENANLIKEGSSVLVRILKQTGRNSYIASFAGGRFSVNSKDALKSGTTFMARVSFQNEKLNLVKISQTQNQIQNSEIKNIVTSSNALTSEVTSLLQSLGLVPDTVSKTLLQTAIASGVKINFEKLNKARAAAIKFEGREDEAAEAALILLEKGIEPTFENISDVLTGFSLEKNFQNEKKLHGEKFDEKEIEEELRNFFKRLVQDDSAGRLSENGEKNFAGRLSEEGEESSSDSIMEKGGTGGLGEQMAGREAGFLALFNHLSYKDNMEGAGHFVVVPFEFEFEKNKKLVCGAGVFRVIFDILKKSIKKLIINFKINGKFWNFVVLLEKEHIKKVKICNYSELSIETDQKLCERLSEFLGGVCVETDSFENTRGFASGEVLINMVKGLA